MGWQPEKPTEIADATALKAGTGLLRDAAGWTLANATLCGAHGLGIVMLISPEAMEKEQTFEECVAAAYCIVKSAQDTIEGSFGEAVMNGVKMLAVQEQVKKLLRRVESRGAKRARKARKPRGKRGER